MSDRFEDLGNGVYRDIETGLDWLVYYDDNSVTYYGKTHYSYTFRCPREEMIQMDTLHEVDRLTAENARLAARIAELEDEVARLIEERDAAYELVQLEGESK